MKALGTSSLSLLLKACCSFSFFKCFMNKSNLALSLRGVFQYSGPTDCALSHLALPFAL